MNDLSSILVGGAVGAFTCAVVIRFITTRPFCWIAEILEFLALYFGLCLIDWLRHRHPEWSSEVKGFLFQVATVWLIMAPTWMVTGKLRARMKKNGPP